ncbi:MAG TPA: hypothetical protein ENK31_00710 [Nannocystis exedens]|nr:hypothetical protein [Nannocystis exedens]
MRDPHRFRIAALALALCTAACASRRLRSPEALRAAYADAINRDDPAAAYALLSPELQARISPEEFALRWARQAEDREAAAADLEALPPAQAQPLYRGQTLHSNGAELRWSYASGAYQIYAGLPGQADISTPAQALRSFIAAIRSADFTALEVLLSEDLRARLGDEWQARVDAIEERLAEPGAIELSPDNQQALLRYDRGRAVALVQSPHGWQITSFQ